MAKDSKTMLGDLGFSTEESQRILQTGVVRSYPSDAIVLNNPHGCELLYLILNGQVDACAIDTEGREAILTKYEQGTYFGGIGFGDVPYAINFKTTEPSNLLELRISEFKEFLPLASDSTKRIFENILSDVEKQRQQLSEAIQQKRAIAEILRAISDSPSDLDSLLDTVAENSARLCEGNDVAKINTASKRI